MRNKRRDPKHSMILLKRVMIIFAVGFWFSASSQTSTAEGLQISNPAWVRDTAKIDKGWRSLNFSVSVEDAGKLQSLRIDLLDKKEAVVVSLGKYEMKQHSSGFYYLENDQRDKTTVMNKLVYFHKKMETRSAAQVIKVKVSYVTANKEERSVTALVDSYSNK